MSKCDLHKLTNCRFACCSDQHKTALAKGLADDLIKNVEEEKFLVWNLFPRLVSFARKNVMSAVLPVMHAAAQ